MNFVVIDSDFFRDISTNILVEEVTRQGANLFTATFHDTDSYDTISQIENHPFREFYIENQAREVLFLYSKNSGPWRTNVDLFELNFDSIEKLISVFGKQALEACYREEPELSNIHFYRGEDLLAGLNCRDDFFSFNEPSNQLLTQLKNKGITYNQ